jgi:hypothetical protein
MERQKHSWDRRRLVPLLGGLLLAVLVAPPARAQADKATGSLSLIPADASFYNTTLRTKEQIDIIAKSKAWQTLWNLPAVQFAWQMAQKHYNGPEAAQLRDFLAQPENQELLALLGDAVSHEMFIYGGSSWVQFTELVSMLNNAWQFGPLAVLAEKGPAGADPQMQVRAVLRAAAAHPELIVIPDFIWGFKLTDTKKAENQLKRLEALLTALADQHPMAKGRIKSVKVGDDTFLSASVDGSMVPWEEIPLKDIEEKEGEFDALVKKLKATTLSVSLGVKNDYLMLVIGASPKVVAELGGQGKRLADRPEMKPVLAAANKRLTSISYTSAAIRAGSALSERDMDSYLELARQGLAKADIPEDKRKKIVKDLEGFSRELLKDTPEVGAAVGYEYMTDGGFESYAYDYTKGQDVDGSKPLTLLSHLGGDPIGAALFRLKTHPDEYKTAVKWLKALYADAEDVLVGKLEKEQKEIYEKVTKEVFPLLRRLDEITGNMLIPALADGQFGIVFDGKWKSKQWQEQVPPTPQAMPLPEFALVWGVSDADLLRKALKGYRELINDAIAKIKEFAPPGADVPEFKIPEPEESDAPKGKVYSYAPPAGWGLDAQIRLAGGLSDKVFVVAFSKIMASRILEPRPLRVEGGPLSDPERPLAAAGYFNWPAFVDLVTPWVEFGLSMAPLPEGGDVPPALRREEVTKQVHTVLRVLKCFRGYSSSVYFESGALVTHGTTVIRDLDAGGR